MIELFEMGASVMVLPAVRHLLERKPDAEIYVLTTIGNRTSWEISDLLAKERIICLDGRSLWSFVSSAARAVRQLRTIGIDLVIDLEKFSRISVILSVLAGARRIAGFHRYEYEGLYRGFSLIDSPCAFNQNEHIALNFFAVAKGALRPEQSYPNLKDWINPDDLKLPKYELSPQGARQVRESLGLDEGESVVVICPDVGTNLSVRNYPVASYAKVAQQLLDESPGRHIAIIGVELNKAICGELESLIGSPRVHNLCGKTRSLGELMDLLAASELLIGNDNGPLHFASLTDTPILGIFSTDSPFMYGPLGEAVVLYTFFHCSPCISALNHKHSKCTDNACIKTIPPHVVTEMSLRLIAGEVQTRTVNGVLPYLERGASILAPQPLVYIGASARSRAQGSASPESAPATTLP